MPDPVLTPPKVPASLLIAGLRSEVTALRAAIAGCQDFLVRLGKAVAFPPPYADLRHRLMGLNAEILATKSAGEGMFEVEDDRPSIPPTSRRLARLLVSRGARVVDQIVGLVKQKQPCDITVVSPFSPLGVDDVESIMKELEACGIFRRTPGGLWMVGDDTGAGLGLSDPMPAQLAAARLQGAQMFRYWTEGGFDPASASWLAVVDIADVGTLTTMTRAQLAALTPPPSDEMLTEIEDALFQSGRSLASHLRAVQG